VATAKKIRQMVPCFTKNRGTKEKRGLSATVNRVGQKNRVYRSKVVCEYSLRNPGRIEGRNPLKLGLCCTCL